MSFEYTTPAITKWKLDDFMEVIDQFNDALADNTHHKICIGHDYQTILVHIAGKSILTTKEILTLCAHGYPDGALSLGRNLYEQMMIAAFFEMHKNDVDFQEYIDDFFLSYEVQRNKCLRDISKYIPEEDHDKLIEEYESLKSRTKRQIKGDYWWARYSTFSDFVFHVMQDQTDEKLRLFLGIHYARYKRACITLHAGCMGNSNRVGNRSGFEVVNTLPTLYGHSTPLLYATVSMISIIGFVCSCFEIDNTEYLKLLNKLAVYYQNEEKEDFEKEVGKDKSNEKQTRI